MADVFEHLARAIRVAVVGGFDDYDSLLDGLPQRIADEGVDDDTLAPRLTALTHDLITQQRAAEKTWSEPTANDRLDEAFATLAFRHDVLVLQNAGYTMSDAWEDVASERSGHPRARGAAVYHGQDLERAVDGKGLYLAFDAFDDDPTHAAAIAIGKTICDVLAAHGFETTWSGTFRDRIRILPFEWRRRREARPRTEGRR